MPDKSGCADRPAAGDQGIVAAPESSHALAQARREALAAKGSGQEKVIVIGLSGHGLLAAAPAGVPVVWAPSV